MTESYIHECEREEARTLRATTPGADWRAEQQDRRDEYNAGTGEGAE